MSPSFSDNTAMRKNGSNMHAGHINLQRNLSTESSDFEFDSSSFSELNDESPLSPKLLFSPNFSPNYSPNGESALMASGSNQFSAEVDTVRASKVDYVTQHRQRPINHEGKKRINLRSLLNRRDLEQLPSLTNDNIIKSNQLQINNKDTKKQVPVKRSSLASTSPSSPSSSSSPMNDRANHLYTNLRKFGDNHPDYAGDASPPQNKSCQKKSRKWAFKVDFLRKGPSPKEDPPLNQSSNDKQADHSLNDGIIGYQPDHCRIAAAAAELTGFDDSRHERDNAAASVTGEGRRWNNYELKQRIDHYRAAAAAGEARFNQHINQSINSNYRAAPTDAAAREARFSHQIHQSGDNYRVAAAMITKFESLRQSACSEISAVSSSARHADNEMIRDNHRKVSNSAPVSRAGSPRKSFHGGEGASPRGCGRSSMSPHALHYVQQRARSEELSRKTFLPYRQSLLSACFFPLSSSQAVY